MYVVCIWKSSSWKYQEYLANRLLLNSLVLTLFTLVVEGSHLEWWLIMVLTIYQDNTVSFIETILFRQSLHCRYSNSWNDNI